jgi:guanine nucleotide-binding protein alpha-1 subunit
VTAVIFLASVSCFDETLAEDSGVNRLEDSYLLWESICSSKLLSKAQLILFLNKCDVLHAKLKRGILIKDSIPSYGKKENDFLTATKCEHLNY